MSDGAMARLALSSGPALVELLPALGGCIARFASRGREAWVDWLRPAPEAPEGPGATACFPLVPFSNRVRDSRFAFQGREILLPREPRYGAHFRHGFGCLNPWQVTARAPDRATLEYRHAAGAWPFPFVARQMFHVKQDCLEVTMSVENLGRDPMPAGLGLHPYFPRSPGCTVQAQVAGMWHVDHEVMPVRLEAPPPADRDPGAGVRVDTAGLDNGFTGWSGQARIVWPERRAALTLTADPPLRFLVIFTPEGRDFFCVEPVSHATDAFNLAAQGRADTGMLVLAPGEAVAATVRFQVEAA